MLILARRVDGAIQIGSDIHVTVARIDGRKVSLHIVDPPNPPQVKTKTVKEGVLIRGGIEIIIVTVSGDTVRLGINAPPDVPVHRSEVVDRIKAEGRRVEDSFSRKHTELYRK